MSLIRLNRIVMSDVVPFNFGMDYDSCLKFYDAHHDTLSQLCPTDPRTWSQETIDRVNQNAKEETELVDRLMALSDTEFHAEVERIQELNRTKEQYENQETQTG